jgi:hypothetical protein
LDKAYIDLEKNIKSFLPNTLTDKEVEFFLNYYRNLINENPELQNQLDSVLYPNNLDKIVEILNGMNIIDDIKQSIIKKFEVFFSELNLKIESFTSKYDYIERKLLIKA